MKILFPNPPAVSQLSLSCNALRVHGIGHRCGRGQVITGGGRAPASSQ